MAGLERGLIQVYTGDGKGKTTAAFGLALRAAGWGLKIHVVQFMKGGRMTGELRALEPLRHIVTVTQFGSGRFVVGREPDEEEKDLARKALEKVQEDFKAGEYDLVILDEISHAINNRLIGLSEVIQLLEQKPGRVELVLTGRNMPQEILDRADLVTEMVAIRHPFEKGTRARRGIEF